MSQYQSEQTGGARAAFLETFNSRLRVVAPPPSFNALTASDEELVLLGLPPKPNPETDRARWDLWTKFFSPRVDYQAEMPRLSVFSVPDAQWHQRGAFGRASHRYECSQNWCGAYVTPNSGRRFCEIYGIWNVPAVTSPLTAPAPPSGEYYSSVFIGLDGQRKYFDASLPQIGTRQNIDATGARIYETWFEWFAHGQPTWPTHLAVPVQPGDSVFCWLTATNPSTVRAMIVNMTTRWGQVVMAEAPDIIVGAGLSKPRVSGATAEWAMERPTSAANTIEALPDYGQVNFEACLAVAAGPLTGTRLHDLTGGRLIRMMERREAPHRSALISRPRQIDATSLSVGYI